MFVLCFRLLLLAAAALPQSLRAAEEPAAVEGRLAESARYLASDELEGRGIGTEGLNLAAEYVARQFAELGLRTELYDGSPFQLFRAATGAKLGGDNRLTLVGPPTQQGGQAERIELRLGDDFTPMAISGSATVDLPLVFVGYGITGIQEGYDDYAGVDVDGKAVVILRHEPQRADPESVFNGTNDSQHAPFRRKVSNASEHGAEAVIFCTDAFEIRRNVNRLHQRWQAALDRLAEEHAKFKDVKAPTQEQIESQRKRIEELVGEVQKCDERLQAAYDPLLPLTAGGHHAQAPDFPVVFCCRAPLNRLFQAALGTDLPALEEQIDEGPTPHSRTLTDWRMVGEVQVERSEAEVKNVLAVLDAEGPLAEETLVIGAHYDHVGRRSGGKGGGAKAEIYNGADDNASGVAVLLEVARSLAQREEKLRRRVVFIAFAAEERGLLGSNHYVKHPLFPVENTIAMLNLDMVGRLRGDKLTVGGSGTAARFDELLDKLNQSHGFQLTKRPSGYGPSDHTSFYAEKVPVMHFYTGVHGDVHRPTDDFDKLNVPGMRRVAALVAETAVALADGEPRPEYVSVGRRGAPQSGGKRPYFGSIPDFSHTGPGYAIRGAAEGSPAEQAGLESGDVIVQLGENKIGSLEDFDRALRKHEAGDQVRILVERDGQQHVFEVTLDPPR
jgi:hypothetical protein